MKDVFPAHAKGGVDIIQSENYATDPDSFAHHLKRMERGPVSSYMYEHTLEAVFAGAFILVSKAYS